MQQLNFLDPKCFAELEFQRQMQEEEASRQVLKKAPVSVKKPSSLSTEEIRAQIAEKQGLLEDFYQRIKEIADYHHHKSIFDDLERKAQSLSADYQEKLNRADNIECMLGEAPKSLVAEALTLKKLARDAEIVACAYRDEHIKFTPALGNLERYQEQARVIEAELAELHTLEPRQSELGRLIEKRQELENQYFDAKWKHAQIISLCVYAQGLDDSEKKRLAKSLRKNGISFSERAEINAYRTANNLLTSLMISQHRVKEEIKRVLSLDFPPKPQGPGTEDGVYIHCPECDRCAGSQPFYLGHLHRFDIDSYAKPQNTAISANKDEMWIKEPVLVSSEEPNPNPEQPLKPGIKPGPWEQWSRKTIQCPNCPGALVPTGPDSWVCNQDKGHYAWPHYNMLAVRVSGGARYWVPGMFDRGVIPDAETPVIKELATAESDLNEPVCPFCSGDLVQIAPRGWECTGNSMHSFWVQQGCGVWSESHHRTGRSILKKAPEWAVSHGT